MPYLDCPYEDYLKLKHVAMSPGLDERNEFSLRALLGEREMAIQRSSVPYRIRIP